MPYDLRSRHLIAGEWVDSERSFESSPSHGPANRFPSGTPEQIDRAVQAAEEAFWSYGWTSREARAVFLETIAAEIEARGEALTEIGSQESGLPEARIQTERGRTCAQLRLFAAHIRDGAYLDRRHDPALPERKPLPRPDLRTMQRPIGPVAVFGASNFPLAFSTAGGDTASALAAGCPVVVKGHPAHPGTGELVAEAVDAAIRACGVAPGVFSFVHGDTMEAGAALVRHPLIRAVGFTGSLRGGKALFDLCMAREEPIPFFGELGSINPIFVLPEALAARGAEIGKGWAGSLTMGAGQFCTKPGIAILVDGPEADAFLRAAQEALSGIDRQAMLTDGIAGAFREGARRVSGREGVRALMGSACETRHASPYLFETTAAAWLADETLGEEVFGPLGVVIRAESVAEMERLARSLKGQLTATLHLDAGDRELGRRLLPVLERKAGRVLANGFPTGVEVSDAMVHGGPYPATTNFGATSVGTLAIRRFLRPVCYQNLPEALLPEDLA